MKTRISRRVEWDMGHRVPDHGSLCFNPHGHRYVAEVVVEGPVNDEPGNPERGMVTDFGILRGIMGTRILEKLDHSFMVFNEDPFAAHLAQFAKHIGSPVKIVEVPFIPTAEKIAEYILKRLDIPNAPFTFVEVTVWETPNCKATVTK